MFLGACSATSDDAAGGGGASRDGGHHALLGPDPGGDRRRIDMYEAEADRDVQVRFADTADLAATLIEEGDDSPADAYFAQEPGAIGAVEDAGVLAELPEDILDRVPPEYRDSGGRWVGVTGRARVMAYAEVDPESELPDSPLDLTDPEWTGRVGWARQRLAAAVRDRAAPRSTATTSPASGCEGMVANGAVDYPDNVSIRDAVANGEIDVGLINHYYVAQAVAAEGPDYPVKVYFPPEGLGSLLLLTSVGVLESSERKEEAFEFVRSLLSDEGQEFFTSTSKEYRSRRASRPIRRWRCRSPDPALPTATSPTSPRPRRRSS